MRKPMCYFCKGMSSEEEQNNIGQRAVEIIIFNLLSAASNTLISGTRKYFDIQVPVHLDQEYQIIISII